MKNYIVKAFHTGGPYHKDAGKLEETAKHFGVPIDIEVIDSLGSWNSNTHYKPQSILNAMDKYPRHEHIIHVDVDAWFMQHPTLFYELDCDLGAFYWAKRKTWCSGTVIVRNTAPMKVFMQNWISALKQDPKQHGDQVAMGTLIDKAKGLDIIQIPAGYLQGLSKHVKEGEGVIAHDGARKRYVGTDIYSEAK